MRRIVAILLFISLSLNSSWNFVVYANYFTNLDYYADVLCINKDKAEMNCKGCCQLKKELIENTNKDSENKPEKIQTLSVSDYLVEVNHCLIPSSKIITAPSIQYLVNHSTHILNGHRTDIFRPPIS